MTRMITPAHLNSNGALFGGQLLKWMDEVAFIAATRYCNKKMVTVSAEKITFKRPVPVGTIIELNAAVKENNGVKLRIHIDVIAEAPDENIQSTIAESWFSFAGIDEKGRPQRIP